MKIGRIVLPVEAVPLIAIVAGACTMGITVGTRTLMYHNDVTIDKSKPYQYQYNESPRMLDKIVPKSA